MAEDMVNLNKENILESIKELTQCTEELLIGTYTTQISNRSKRLYRLDYLIVPCLDTQTCSTYSASQNVHWSF